MNNIKIEKNSTFLASGVYEECIPKRFAVATNLLLCADMENNQKGFMLFNYEPQKWNQWYPFFSSINGMYDFKGKTFGELVTEFETNIMSCDEVKNRIKKSKEAFLEQLGMEEAEINLVEAAVTPEMWLKYSKTQNVWTFYLIEFLQVSSINPFEFNSLESDSTTFMPLTKQTIEEVIKTNKYLGIDVVDNTIDIIKDESILRQIMNISV